MVDGMALPSADVEALKLGLRTETAGLDTQQLEAMLEAYAFLQIKAFQNDIYLTP